jgi:hypothetical protein
MVTLDGSGSSDPDGDALTYSWSGAFGTASGVNPSVTLPLGTHTVTLSVDDGNGGTASDTVAITVQDTTAPSTSVLITGTEGLNGWYVSEVTVDLNASDSCTGVADITYTVDGVSTTVSDANASFLLVVGIHQITFAASDNAGNTEAPHLFTLNVDTAPPVITVTGVANGNIYALGQVPTAGYSAADATSGVATSTGDLTGGDGLGLGVYTYLVSATDNAGLTADVVITYEVIATPEGSINLIADLLGQGMMSAQTAKVLTGMMNGVLAANTATSAEGKLGAFINHIEAQVDKSITSEAAKILINAAMYMINN